ncbi:hypothetical protein IWW50_003060 [Coemansia erecta]|nr:hypothetical protein IWW50_003060 [Coemansia erecta]
MRPTATRQLSSAQENLEARTQNLDTEQVALRECKEQLNTALSHVTKSFATITSQDPGFLAPYPHLKTWLKNLVAAREAGSSAQTKVNNAKDKYELAQERHNVAKSRVEMEQRIRHVKARIESNLSIGN